MQKILLACLTIISVGACLKQNIGPTDPPRPITPLPGEVIRNYESFPETDTLYTTGINQNAIGFTYRDYWNSFYHVRDLSDWTLDYNLLKIAHAAYEKIFPDTLKIDDRVLNDYDIFLEIRRYDGTWQFSRKWPLYKVRRHR
jgi:hypothetical protein